METIRSLSPAKSILLAAESSARSNINDLRILTAVHANLFAPELVYRILLTFLPEITSPEDYIPFLEQLATGAGEPVEELGIDCSPVEQLAEEKARKRVKRLHLLRLRHSSLPEDTVNDPFVLFLIHRAHLIEERSGQIQLIRQLVTPFLDRSEYLRVWYVSVVLPLSRWNDEYYLQDDDRVLTMDAVEDMQGGIGVAKLMSESIRASKDGSATGTSVGRDLRGLVGPWTYGANQRKRRKFNTELAQQPQVNDSTLESADDQAQFEEWQHTFQWIVATAVTDLPLSVKAIDGWDGPNDVDLDGHNIQWRVPQEDAWKDERRLRYCQAAFACVYATEDDTDSAIEGAHAILTRLADLLNFIPPPDLATSIQLLPRIEKKTEPLEEISRYALSIDSLLDPNHPLTTPDTQSYNILQMLVYSAYLLKSVGHALPVLRVAKLRFWSDAVEQLALLQRILGLVERGPRRDDDQMSRIRDVLLWLHDWNIPASPQGDNEDGYGILGKLSRPTLEKELLKTLCSSSVRADLIHKIYLAPPPSEQPLPPQELEETLIHIALSYYDNASNGNRTRGGVKRALDVVSAFRSSFPNSPAFDRVTALIAATHSLSFYSLTLQRGIPFQPVSIRVAEDPIALIEKVLVQNPRSYTKLDDLIGIARNLVKATPSDHHTVTPTIHTAAESEADRLVNAERRTFLMAINAALAEDDFETAYSYVINRLSSSPDALDDDISWRAADMAGRHRSSTPSADPAKQLRRLEQRMELLSKATNLAPPQHMVEAVSAWRRVEEEWKALQDREREEQESFDARGDVAPRNGAASRGESGMPGAFGGGSAGEELHVQVQPVRKEMGRGAAEEAPMGLFDVASSAAAALSRSYGKARGGKGGRGSTNSAVSRTAHQHARSSSDGRPRTSEGDDEGEEWGWGAEGDGEGEEAQASREADRVRKRDIVASAVTDRLASGIGWVLGASPMREGSE